MFTNIVHPKIHLLGLALLVIGATTVETAHALDRLPEVTVEGGLLTRTKIGPAISRGAPTEKITISRTVSYADLDLTTDSGVSELEQRVARTAKANCRELDTLFPLLSTAKITTRDCIAKSIKEAKVQTQIAQEAAQKSSMARS